MIDETASNAMAAASAGVQELARAATSALDQAGPGGALLQPVVDALRDVWEGYFGSPIPPGGTNWNAYTHEQLYQMLWQNADVGDVSTMAAEWGRHSTELSDRADAMRQQRSAMQANWSSEAGALAADRLGEMGERAAGISDRAYTAQQATQEAADALAAARNAMPPPPGDPTGSVLAGAAAGAGAGAVIGGVVGAGAGGVGAGPGALMGAAIGAVAVGGASLFLSSVTAAQKKAEAVHVMQRYEMSLRNSSRRIAPVSAGAQAVRTFDAPAQTTAAGFAGGGSTSAGLPWHRLVGADPLEPGLRSGGGALGGALARSGVLSGLAAARAASGSGLVPPGAAPRHGADDEEKVHHNRLPTIDQGLFDDDRPASAPVIGQ
ncbi:hypothetical protein GCM10011581_24890 [Saccharopolyspora subtropica]|uniref:PPE family protein n=1 Tax=Saccharopolyspora thermophila TaxID=89367 RepID=A0A917JVD9_9PSEU|nr:hypothetical protein [Saccharopolyspora subtropica]GGI86812.1 hypothetical protein GCM10011581_24890 [Saccharopolyspora subtropica]